jgi:AcrR family transcriptional regulator
VAPASSGEDGLVAAVSMRCPREESATIQTAEWNDVPGGILEHRSSFVKILLVAIKTQRTERRADALSKQRIVEAAIEILDAGGERALTFRALAARLATGSGAIYWHIANRNDLLAAASDDIIARVRTDAVAGAGPREAIRTLALGVFDAIDAHPWVGAQLSRQKPWQSAVLQILENVGEQLQALGVPEHAQFDSVSALVSYVFGAAGQKAANARLLTPGTDRSAVLATVAARWAKLDPADFPFMRQVATQMRAHDDREQFLVGIDLILAGIATLR